MNSVELYRGGARTSRRLRHPSEEHNAHSSRHPACIPLQSSSEHDSLLKQIKRAKNGTEIKKYSDANSSDGPLDMGANFVHIIWLDSLIELDEDKN